MNSRRLLPFPPSQHCLPTLRSLPSPSPPLPVWLATYLTLRKCTAFLFGDQFRSACMSPSEQSNMSLAADDFWTLRIGLTELFHLGPVLAATIRWALLMCLHRIEKK